LICIVILFILHYDGLFEILPIPDRYAFLVCRI
jgi:hypothetical protein